MDTKNYRVQRNNANYTAITPFKVIQGQSLILVPIESSYATSY